MSDARKLADEKLRGAVGAVVAARNPRRRAEVTATLLREVQGEQARIRHEGRLWALQTVEQHGSRVVDAVKDCTDAAKRTVLEDVAANAAEVSDDLLTPLRAVGKMAPRPGVPKTRNLRILPRGLRLGLDRGARLESSRPHRHGRCVLHRRLFGVVPPSVRDGNLEAPVRMQLERHRLAEVVCVELEEIAKRGRFASRDRLEGDATGRVVTVCSSRGASYCAKVPTSMTPKGSLVLGVPPPRAGIPRRMVLVSPRHR